MKTPWQAILLAIAAIQLHLAAGQFECNLCYRREGQTLTRTTTRTLSTSGRCWGFFRCTTYRLAYQTETYTTHTTIAYCCRTTGTVTPMNGALQLEGGSRENTGRLKVYYSSQWGTVCDDQFNHYDASVACYQMGFAGQSSYRTVSGPSGPIWLDGLLCQGTETWLSNCPHEGWGRHDCSHNEDVGLTCASSLQVRLVGGSPIEGRVEYYKGGSWGTVCDDLFDTLEGNVICRQLGYGDAVRVGGFGRGSGPILFDDLECNGRELFLSHCPHSTSHNCDHSEDAGVACQGPSASIARLSSTSPSTVVLSWSYAWQLKFLNVIRSFVVQYGTSTHTALRTARFSSSSTSATLSGLVGGQTYYLRIAIVLSGTGVQGPYSSFRSVRTVNAAPRTPISCSGYATSSTQIRIQWSYPIPTSTVTGFQINYNVVQPQGLVVDGEVEVTRDTSSHSIASLEEDVQYRVTIKSYLSQQYSSPCSILVRTFTAQPSGIPQNVRIPSRTSTTLSVTWMPPDLRHRNGPISSYKVYVYRQYSSSLVYVQTVYSTSVVVRTLSPYTTYRVRVAAQNANGTGPFSSYISERTSLALPSTPRSVAAIATGTSSIRLQWLPPATANGVITGYSIQYFSKGRLVATVSEPSHSTRKDFVNLLTFSEYSFLVAAKNSLGTGSFSTQVLATTFSNVPSGPPRSVALSAQSSSTISISWTLPDSGKQNGIISGYFIAYGKMSDLRDRTTVAAASSPHSVHNLDPYVLYHVQVAAATVNGTGVYSATASTRTDQDVPTKPPVNLQTSVNSQAPQITVSWSPPPTNGINSPLSSIHYQLEYNLVGSPESTLTIRANRLSLVLDNLRYCREYLIRVAAVNSVGMGPYSPITIASTTALGHCTNSPLNVVILATSSRSLTVTWQPPLDGGSNSGITAYKIVYGKLNEASQTITHRNLSSLEVSLSGLVPFTTYGARVAAVRGDSIGRYSNTTYNKTFSEVPPKFNADSISTTVTAYNVTLQWEPPENPYGVIVAYAIDIRRRQTTRQGRSTLEIGGHLTSYTIASLLPYSLYCFSMAAVNEEGAGAASDDVCVTTLEDVPGPVGNVQVVSVAATSLQVQWIPPANPRGRIRQYIVRYLPSNSDITFSSAGTRSVSGRDSAPSVVLDGLEEGVQYRIRVAAVTRVGEGEEVPLTASTLTAVPTGPPLNVEVSVRGPYSLAVTWQPPEASEHNGPLTQYSVLVVSSVSEDDNATVLTSDASVTVTDLTPYTLYYVQVAAVNVNGTGPFSEIQENVTDAARPSAPTSLSVETPSSQLIVISWSAPTAPNGMLEGYRLSYRAVKPVDLPSNERKAISVNLDIPFTSHRLSSLHEGVLYEVEVFAVNQVGESSGGAVRSVSTVSARPELPPVEFNVTMVTSESVTLSWKQPPVLSRNGPLREYSIRFFSSAADSSSAGSLIVISTSDYESLDPEISHTIITLKPFTTYRFSIAARNDVGYSPYTADLVQRTSEGIPSEVRNLTAKLSNTFVLLSWLPPLNPNGDVIHYRISVDNRPVGVIGDVQLDYNVTNLKEKSQYEIAVIAENSAGNSTANKLTVYTLGDSDKSALVSTSAVGPELFAMIGGVVVGVLCIIGCCVIVICCGVHRYWRVKAMARGAEGMDLPDTVSLRSGIYEEINDDFKAAVALYGKECKETEAAEPSKMENHYTLGRGEGEEKQYATPIIGCRSGSPTVSITEDTLPPNGVYESVYMPPNDSGTVSVSPNGAHYSNTLPQATAATAGYSNTGTAAHLEEPEEVYDYAITTDVCGEMTCDYDVPKTGVSVVAAARSTGLGYDVPKGGPNGEPKMAAFIPQSASSDSQQYETMSAIRLESASDSVGSDV